MDDVMLPGFRFHPTDEELVGFYLKKKIQHRSLPIELIKQLNIYKYDPWDLPNLAPSGEKEWYFYCPRDRKYKNSTRPNRVTGAGFWKATGTDRPIYSSDGTKCIGLKKSLVFYRGRAAKGIKTDWMMHEFRLPNSLAEPTTAKNIQDKNLPPNDSWAICRIFKKTNSMAHRSLSHHSSEFFSPATNHFTPTNISSIKTHYLSDLNPPSIHTFSGLETPPQTHQTTCNNNNNGFPFAPPFTDVRGGFVVSSIEPNANYLDSSVIVNLDQGGSSENPDQDTDLRWGRRGFDNFQVNHYGDREMGNGGNDGFPFGFPASGGGGDEWKINMAWDSPPPCHSESTTFSSNKCYN
ncbi:hypothetical protein L6452_41553 [Arctium lappa]|uniref:Uncharacterized protein n=1 Tax=Arctium lappa TaxID=4217 RepID=A0ACB8XQB4_ARCLA|nr:hypothetical protein L6452_41553 [Arctium lappa]